MHCLRLLPSLENTSQGINMSNGAMVSNKDFLDELTEWAKAYGWLGNYSEITSFVRWVHHESGINEPTPDELRPVDS